MPSLPLSEAAINETVHFPAGPYRLEGELAYPDAAAPTAAAVLAGPHPLLGGSMNNNVVRALGDGLAQLGLATLRFNYRGVGRSAGPKVDVPGHLAQFWQTSHVSCEHEFQSDLDGASAFLRAVVGEALPLARVGYSFGCTLLPGSVADDPTAPLVLIAPTIGTHAYDGFDQVPNPKLVVAAEGDFAAEAGSLRVWFDQLPGPRCLVQPKLDGHFFRGHEDWLVETVGAFLLDQWR